MAKYDSIIILGPTGSGKTELSLMLGKALNGEIVNADSMQVYKKMDIGTAKATDSERKIIPHHLFDLVEPDEDYTVSNYKTDASILIKKLITEKKVPIIVGGTGFYIQSLLYDFDYGKSSKDESIREKYAQLINQFGNEYVYNILKQNDPQTALKLHYNDTKRVIRALEIYETTGLSKTEINTKKESNLINPLIIGLNYPRETLYDRINKRVDIMIQSGLIDEIKKLLELGYDENSKGMQGIGYKELLPYFKNSDSLDTCIDKIKQNTRNYAKRQITWFKKQQNIHWFDKSQNNLEIIYNQILNLFNET